VLNSESDDNSPRACLEKRPRDEYFDYVDINNIKLGRFKGGINERDHIFT